DIEAPLQGTLLAIRNKDVPGVIGRIGTILGEHKINIANFALGRADSNGAATALAVLQIDGTATEAAVKELRSVDAITGVRQVVLPAD
ncbi:MAG TPA: ACT domain-containing protein, partial [Acidobacteriaceae bacterium]|nr:ACT domain-containing protein [Acidobacteriaceae bacterium]